MRGSLEVVKTKWIGVTELMCHNGQLANPLSVYARKVKALSSKRKKTDEELIALSRMEWEGGFYWHEEFGPSVPCNNVLATIVAGAKKSKSGKETNLGVFVEGLPRKGDAGFIGIDYPGPRTFAEMWGDGSSRFISTELVNVNRARIMRTRPKFPDWSLEFLVKFDPSILNAETLIRAMRDAGFFVGLCEWRPRYGRFEVEAKLERD